MALTVNFDAPKSASSRVVTASGTVAAGSIGHLKITLNVTTGATINRSFYRDIDYDNSAATGVMTITNVPYTLTITPKILTTETVNETTGVLRSWSYTEP
ncbi:hypothetical protein [Clostridium sp. 'White wine YQ']|uniref:hypothetical protein n=1 Tax=Clostridium sp. 'White wine YQ' TaxID=3027474 RepID=UPI0023661A6B|nr:hypothetical protein [Clostridium sp. 'White wine YQ']MDD7795326.1 hypothetical protein [Clostridium sp. 'White wine YQ']